MDIKIKILNIELKDYEANNMEEELNSLIYGISFDSKEQIDKYPNLNKLRDLLKENKSIINNEE